MASTSSEAPPLSHPESISMNNSTKTKRKSNFSIRFLFTFLQHVFASRFKPAENTIHRDASSNATTNNDDHHGRVARLMREDLDSVDKACKDTEEYMEYMKRNIRDAREELEVLQDLQIPAELRKAIKKLKVQIPWNARIPWHVKHRSAADSNRDPYQRPYIRVAPHPWPNINGADDRMIHFLYKEEPPVDHTADYDMLIQDFRLKLTLPLQRCLLCFFKFPPEAIIKRTTMIYLWIGQGYAKKFSGGKGTNENACNEIFDELVKNKFIQPIKQNYSLVPDSYKMIRHVRSALYERAEYEQFSSNGAHKEGRSCLINVGEAIINWEPELFGNADKIRSLYLGRWQSSVEHRQSVQHHIEVADPEILRKLKILKNLKFLSLRGISMIKELSNCILELERLMILDLRACYNLEAIPDNIGLLENLTHLDMSECYFLVHMPRSLAQLSNLEVLKGFLIGDVNPKKQSCTLSDLSRLRKLRKLSIYISLKDDSQERCDFDDLKKFKVLQKLAISWGGCSFQGENCTQIQDKLEEENNTPIQENVGEENCTPIQEKGGEENYTSIQEKTGEIQEEVGQIQQEVGEENCIPIQEKVEEENCTPIQEKVGEENCTPIQEKVGEIQEEVGEENCTPIQEKVEEENSMPIQEKVGEKNCTPIQGKVGEIQEEVVGEKNCAPIQGKVGEIQEEDGEENCTPIQEKDGEENCTSIQEKTGEIHEEVGQIQQEVGEENCKLIQEKIGEENCPPIQEKVREENCTLIQEKVEEIQEEVGEEICKPIQEKVEEENSTPIQEKVGEDNCTPIQGKVGEIQEEVAGDENNMPIQGKVGEIQEEVVGEENCALIQGKVGEIQEEAGEENCIPIQEKVGEENCTLMHGKVGEKSGKFSTLLTKGSLKLPPKLQKLDLQGFPEKCLTDWLTPSKVPRGLEKLYIRGGQLCDIGQNLKGEKWNVKTLRLKYLSELKIDWSELMILFPKLIYLHQEGCFKFTSFQCDEQGMWNKAGTDSDMQL